MELDGKVRVQREENKQQSICTLRGKGTKTNTTKIGWYYKKGGVVGPGLKKFRVEYSMKEVDYGKFIGKGIEGWSIQRRVLLTMKRTINRLST